MLKDFEYYAPTRVVFGKDSEERIAEMVNMYGGKRVLVHYGGQCPCVTAFPVAVSFSRKSPCCPTSAAT